jgi:hypothetical protein
MSERPSRGPPLYPKRYGAHEYVEEGIEPLHKPVWLKSARDVPALDVLRRWIQVRGTDGGGALRARALSAERCALRQPQVGPRSSAITDDRYGDRQLEEELFKTKAGASCACPQRNRAQRHS